MIPFDERASFSDGFSVKNRQLDQVLNQVFAAGDGIS